MGILKSRSWVDPSATDENHSDNEKIKIELVHCQLQGENCNNQLVEINQNFVRSNQFRIEKEYQRSIDELIKAYNTTKELDGSVCIKCAELFRSTISKSLENLLEELKYMSVGRFGSKRYKSIYLMVRNVLDDLRNRNNPH